MQFPDRLVLPKELRPDHGLRQLYGDSVISEHWSDVMNVGVRVLEHAARLKFTKPLYADFCNRRSTGGDLGGE